jgi:hypothetical protein
VVDNVNLGLVWGACADLGPMIFTQKFGFFFFFFGFLADLGLGWVFAPISISAWGF